LDIGQRSSLADAFPDQFLFVNASLANIETINLGVRIEVFPTKPENTRALNPVQLLTGQWAAYRFAR
jgi:hypothetical protein